MRVAQYSNSSASVDVVVVPVTVTNENGGRSSSKHTATRPPRRMDLPLIVSADVMNTISSPSSSTHTGATCGRPSSRVTATLPVRAGSADTKLCHQPCSAAASPIAYDATLDPVQVVSA